MSNYQDSWNCSAGDNQRKAFVPEAFRAEYPSVAEVLGGIEVAAGEQGGVPPSTVNLWFEGGELRFCIMPRIGNRIAFGVIKEAHRGIAGLEEELQEGRFGWKNGKNRRST